MYRDCTIHLQVGKDEREIKYGTGVQQGDNMAPILFLFRMQAAYEMSQKKSPVNPLNSDTSPTIPRIHKTKMGILSLKIHPAMAKPPL